MNITFHDKYIDSVECQDAGELKSIIEKDTLCDSAKEKEKLMNENERFRGALKTIKQYMEISCPSACGLKLSTIYYIATRALETKNETNIL